MEWTGCTRDRRQPCGSLSTEILWGLQTLTRCQHHRIPFSVPSIKFSVLSSFQNTSQVRLSSSLLWSPSQLRYQRANPFCCWRSNHGMKAKTSGKARSLW